MFRIEIKYVIYDESVDDWYELSRAFGEALCPFVSRTTCIWRLHKIVTHHVRLITCLSGLVVRCKFMHLIALTMMQLIGTRYSRYWQSQDNAPHKRLMEILPETPWPSKKAEYAPMLIKWIYLRNTRSYFCNANSMQWDYWKSLALAW